MPINKGHITAVKVIGGAAETITLIVDGEASWENGGYEMFPYRDTVGAYTDEAPGKGNEQETTLNLTFTMRGFPDPAAALVGDLTSTDVANRTPKFLSLVTSTASSGTACSGAGEYHTITIELDDCASGTDTITFTRCTWTSSTTFAAEGSQTTMSIRSFAAEPAFS